MGGWYIAGVHQYGDIDAAVNSLQSPAQPSDERIRPGLGQGHPASLCLHALVLMWVGIIVPTSLLY